MNKKIKVGLYGTNGHQIHKLLQNHPLAELHAVAGFDDKTIATLGKSVKIYSSLDELIADKDIDLVSLCSPKRSKQKKHAVKCMKAGKHVYAEKPCAMTVKELDKIIRTSKSTGRIFHEMAGTAFEQPYLEMRKIVQSGKIGTVVQVLAQKSYPYFDTRPQDEDVDGGLMLQVGIHAMRFIEHVACAKIANIEIAQTKLGSTKKGDLRMAVSYLIKLENGGIASALANYLNPRAFPSWGNESLRIFGTKGFIEAVDGGTRTRLVLNEKDCGPIEIKGEAKDYFDMFAASLLGKGKMPLSLEDELHPLRMLLKARG
ncbi:MAG: hypothetical protein A2X48_16070 [Lentisphaerae bacterium GWF2_49_21]|nr:MAG: hypothetical protein A2X48_16070 [Lentisphaerae bacterium GWF2_49_21]